MMNFSPIVYLLLSKGAKENPKVIHIRGFRSQQLVKLLAEAERHTADLTSVMVNSTSSATGGTSSSLLKVRKECTVLTYLRRDTKCGNRIMKVC
eukprot:m.69024 g.69024  ORF g.69024 m.69024 type:complete len:94 (+) comp35577_c0_seq11:1142-1423(+)